MFYVFRKLYDDNFPYKSIVFSGPPAIVLCPKLRMWRIFSLLLELHPHNLQGNCDIPLIFWEQSAEQQCRVLCCLKVHLKNK